MHPRDVLQYNLAFMEDHCPSCQWLNEDVVVPTGWTAASDTAEAVATTVGAALVAAIIPSIAPCLLDVLLKSRHFVELSGTVFQCVHHGTETHRLLKITMSWTLSWIPVTSRDRILAATLPERGSLRSVCRNQSSVYGSLPAVGQALFNQL